MIPDSVVPDREPLVEGAVVLLVEAEGFERLDLCNGWLADEPVVDGVVRRSNATAMYRGLIR